MSAASRPDVERGRLGLGASFAASALVHLLVFVLLIRLGPGPIRPAIVPIPVMLVGAPGGGGGAARAEPEPAAPEATAPRPVRAEPVPAPPRRRERVVARASHKAPPAAEVSTSAPTGDVGARAAVGGEPSNGSGGGDGSGGPGDGGGARVAYGENPLPPYPLMARRLGQEGVVLLEVLVARDGHAADVRLVRSSGFAPLDDSAMSTVRDRWRFIPARRGEVPVESRVTVPIRFRLADG